MNKDAIRVLDEAVTKLADYHTAERCKGWECDCMIELVQKKIQGLRELFK